MIKHSANLGYLWQELDLIEGIRAAKKAGFVAVECHWPFAYSTQTVLDVLTETGLPMVGLNTDIGNRELGEFGVCAHPDRSDEAHQVIDQAIEYAFQIKTPNVHVMAGTVTANCDQELAMKVFKDNLFYAAKKAEKYGIDILIEPINRIDVPDYFLGDMNVAVAILKDLNLPNLKIMYDCFHIQKVHGDLKELAKEHIDLIGHIQIASFPDRHEPDEGLIDYAYFFSFLENLGYSGYVGAEYKPRTSTDEGLAWLKKLKV
ncbi:MAG: hydroxypyruvate isomerase [Cocleimonas sp.]|jgi:hydroxypyruvate isomerase